MSIKLSKKEFETYLLDLDHQAIFLIEQINGFIKPEKTSFEESMLYKYSFLLSRLVSGLSNLLCEFTALVNFYNKFQLEEKIKVGKKNLKKRKNETRRKKASP